MREQRTPRVWKCNVYGETEDARRRYTMRDRGVTRYVVEKRKRIDAAAVIPVSELVKRANEILRSAGERKLARLI